MPGHLHTGTRPLGSHREPQRAMGPVEKCQGKAEGNRTEGACRGVGCTAQNQQKRKCVWAGTPDPWQQEGITEGCGGSIPLLPKSLHLPRGLTCGEMCFTAGLCPSRAWQGLVAACPTLYRSPQPWGRTGSRGYGDHPPSTAPSSSPTASLPALGTGCGSLQGSAPLRSTGWTRGGTARGNTRERSQERLMQQHRRFVLHPAPGGQSSTALPGSARLGPRQRG